MAGEASRVTGRCRGSPSSPGRARASVFIPRSAWRVPGCTWSWRAATATGPRQRAGLWPKVWARTGSRSRLPIFRGSPRCAGWRTRSCPRIDRIDVLVNNAGLFSPRYRLSADGFELTFAVNHLAPFLLTNLLLDRLKASAPARIVTVASEAHRRQPDRCRRSDAPARIGR